MVTCCPDPFRRLEKSPVRHSSSGTVAKLLVPLRARTLCSLKKKKVRFRPLYSFGIHTGPPNVPPNSLRCNGGRGVLFRRLLQVFASRLLLRRNSKSVKCAAFVPERVDTLITPPPVLPYSAARELVITVNSSMLSTIGWWPSCVIPVLF